MKKQIDFKKLEDYWFVVCETNDLKNKPVGFKLLNKSIVLFRDEKGKPIAFIDRCPHRNVKVSEGTVNNGILTCPYHGWEFNSEGKCTKVPGRVDEECETLKKPRIRKYDVFESNGLIWVKLNPRSDRKPHLPEHITGNHMNTYSFRTHMKSGMVNVAESFLDPFHTPFVHAGIIRTEAKRSLNKIDPKHIEDGLEVLYLKDKPQSGILGVFGRDIRRDLGRFLMPGIIELESFSGQSENLEFINTMYITPRSESETSVYFKASIKPKLIPTGVLSFLGGFFIKTALKQDIVILEKQTNVINEFGGEAFVDTELDIVREQLDNLYSNNGKLVEFKPLEALI